MIQKKWSSKELDQQKSLGNEKKAVEYTRALNFGLVHRPEGDTQYKASERRVRKEIRK